MCARYTDDSTPWIRLRPSNALSPTLRTRFCPSNALRWITLPTLCEVSIPTSRGQGVALEGAYRVLSCALGISSCPIHDIVFPRMRQATALCNDQKKSVCRLSNMYGVALESGVPSPNTCPVHGIIVPSIWEAMALSHEQQTWVQAANECPLPSHRKCCRNMSCIFHRI